MSELSKLPRCYGDMRDGNTYAERGCHDCLHMHACRSITHNTRLDIDLGEETTTNKWTKTLDKEWVDWAIDMIIGPSLIILGMKSPKDAATLRKILIDAIFDLHKDWTRTNSNEWVVAVSNRLHELYNTYMTAKLIHFLDNGVPAKSKIVTPDRVITKMH